MKLRIAPRHGSIPTCTFTIGGWLHLLTQTKATEPESSISVRDSRFTEVRTVPMHRTIKADADGCPGDEIRYRNKWFITRWKSEKTTVQRREDCMKEFRRESDCGRVQFE